MRRDSKPPARRSYNDYESGGSESQAPSNPYGCSAWGCPLSGSIVVDGSRVCFVHRKVPDRKYWDDVTTKIKRHPVLCDVSRTLRPSMPSDVEEKAVAAIADLVPEVVVTDEARKRFGARYALLLAVETRLEKLCVEDAEMARDSAVQTMRNQFRSIGSLGRDHGPEAA